MSLRMLDWRCGACGSEKRDVLMDSADPAPECCGEPMAKMLAAPLVDARDEWYCQQSGRRFSSFRQTERWKDSMGREFTTVPKKDFETMRWDAQKKIDEKAARQRQTAVEKAVYRVGHGYRDYPRLPGESETR